MCAPLFEQLKNYAEQGRVSFAMPGHKGRADFSDIINCDVTELSSTADLHAESEAVGKANELLSRLYKSDRSFILSGGSTTAIHAMIASALRPGDVLLTTAGCHMSVINICAVMGIKLRIADTDFNDEFMISGQIKSVRKYLDKYPDIRAALITSPDYYGACADIRRIAAECHAHGKPLIVDEAHGAHFIASDKLPESSSYYADLVCHSAHKTLNALTGAAYLHVRGDLIPEERVRRFINIFETSSPSYPVAVSADLAREELENGGGWDKTIDLCGDFKERVRELGIKTLKNDDKTRVVLSFGKFDTTGYKIESELSGKYGIDIEMADLLNLVLIVTPQNTSEDFDKLYTTLVKITQKLKPRGEYPRISEKFERGGIINPQAALFADGEDIEIGGCAGRISRVTVTAYPPGTPVIFAGEMITDAHIAAVSRLIKSGAKITGMKNNYINAVKDKWKN